VKAEAAKKAGGTMAGTGKCSYTSEWKWQHRDDNVQSLYTQEGDTYDWGWVASHGNSYSHADTVGLLSTAGIRTIQIVGDSLSRRLAYSLAQFLLPRYWYWYWY
jgi:hypothetical protein